MATSHVEVIALTDLTAAALPDVSVSDRPWERADVTVYGAPSLEHDPTTQVVVSRSKQSAQGNEKCRGPNAR